MKLGFVAGGAVDHLERFDMSRWAVIKDAFRRQRRRRRRMLTALAAVGVAAFAWLTMNGHSENSSPASSTPPRYLVTAVVGLKGTLIDTAVTPTTVWVLTCLHACSGIALSSGQLVEISSGSGEIVRRFPVRDPQALAVGDGALWIAHFHSGTVTRVDPNNGRTSAIIHLKLPAPVVRNDRQFLPSTLSFGQRRVWVSTARGWIAEIDPSAVRTIAMVRTPSEDNATSSGQSGTWVAENLAGLGFIAPGSQHVSLHTISEAGETVSIHQVMTGRGQTWALGSFPNPNQPTRAISVLVTINPHDGHVIRRTVLAGANDAILYGNRELYVAEPSRGVLLEIGRHGMSHRVRSPKHFEGLVATTPGGVWVTTTTGTLLRITTRSR